MDIYNSKVFFGFVIAGIAQVAVAWNGGYLAVLGVEDKLKRKRLFHLLFFGVLGFLLCAVTVYVGVQNDKALRAGDAQADLQGKRAEALQLAVDGQTRLLKAQSELLARSNDAISHFKIAQPSAYPGLEKLQQEIAEMQSTVTAATHQPPPAPAPPPATPKGPYENLTDDQFRDVVAAFQKDANARYRDYYDLEDRLGRAGRVVADGPLSSSARETAFADFMRLDLQYQQINANMLTVDIPKANELIAEANRRTHGSTSLLKTAPVSEAANAFTTRLRYFNDIFPAKAATSPH